MHSCGCGERGELMAESWVSSDKSSKEIFERVFKMKQKLFDKHMKEQEKIQVIYANQLPSKIYPFNTSNTTAPSTVRFFAITLTDGTGLWEHTYVTQPIYLGNSGNSIKKKLVSVLRNSQIKEVDWELGLGGASAIPAPVIKVLPDYRGHGGRRTDLLKKSPLSNEDWGILQRGRSIGICNSSPLWYVNLLLTYTGLPDYSDTLGNS